MSLSLCRWHFLLLLMMLIQPAAASTSLTPSVYQDLQQLQQALDEQHPEQARALLERARKHGRTAYDRALIEQNQVYVAMASHDYGTAAEAITRALASKQLPIRSINDLQYLLAQLLARDGNTAAAIELLQALLQRKTSPDGARLLLARLYLRNQQARQAAELLRPMIGHQHTVGTPAHDLFAVAEFRLGRYRQAATLLETLLRQQPQRSAYWLRLAASQQAAGDNNQALTTLQLAYYQGALTRPEELLRLARLYRSQGLPVQAALLLQRQIDTQQITPTTALLRELASAWQQAREWRRATDTLKQALAITAAETGAPPTAN